MPARFTRMLLMLLGALILAGCSLLGPSREEILIERKMWDMAETSLVQSDALHQKALEEMRDYALAQALEGNRQAALDSTHQATIDGKVDAKRMEEIQQWLVTRNKEETDRIWAAYTASLDPKSRRDFREVLWKMRALRMSRLSAEDLKHDTLEFLMETGRDVGVIKGEE